MPPSCAHQSAVIFADLARKVSRASRAQLNLLGKGLKNALKLGCVDVDGGFGPDEEISGLDLLRCGPLGGKALGDLFGSPAAGKQPALLGPRRAGDADRHVAFLFRVSLEQERNDDGGEPVALGSPGEGLCQPTLANAGVKDTFEFRAEGRV